MEQHQWGKTFMGDRFPLICGRCLSRSDAPEAERECDRALERMQQVSTP
jgi:hypothetical protein